MQTNNNPFRGLAPFSEQDSGLLFERDRDLTLLRQIVLRQPISLLISPAGAGKTSLLRAGLVPGLRSDVTVAYCPKWHLPDPARSVSLALDQAYELTVPSSKPVPADGTSAFRSPTHGAEREEGAEQEWCHRLACLPEGLVVLILDQFEELLLAWPDTRLIQDFLESLQSLQKAPHHRVRILLALREQRLGALASAEPVWPEILSSYCRLSLPTREQAVAIVTRTCRQVGAEICSQGARCLVRDLASAAQGSDGAAEGASRAVEPASNELEPALLQLLCSELWQRWARQPGIRQPFLQGYKVGNAGQVLGELVDERLGRLEAPEQQALAMAVEPLVSRQGGTPWTLEGLKARLRKTQRLHWAPRQRGVELESAAARLSEGAGSVLRAGASLEGPLVEIRHPSLAPHLLSWRARFFRRREQRRRRLGIVAAGLVLLAAAGFLYWSYLPGQDERTLRSGTQDYALAIRAKSRLEWMGLRSRAQRGMAEYWLARSRAAQLRQDRDSALLMALRSADYRMDGAGRRVTDSLNSGSYSALSQTWRLAGGVSALEAHPSGTRFAVGGKDGSVLIVDAESGQARSLQSQPQAAVAELLFSPDGEVLVARGWDDRVRIWHSFDSEPLYLEGRYSVLEIDPAGQALALGRILEAETRGRSDSGEVVLQSLADGEERKVKIPTLRRVSALAFAPQGQTLAIGDRSGQVYRLRLDSLEMQRLLVEAPEIKALDFSPDGETLWVGDRGGTVRHMDLDLGTVSELQHEGVLSAARVLPDGRAISASFDGTLRLWGRQRGTPEVVLDQGRGGVRGMSLSADGQWLMSAAGDSFCRIWDLRQFGSAPRLLPCPGEGWNPLAILEGPRFLSADGEAIRLWELPTPSEGERLEAAPGVRLGQVLLSADGRVLASQSESEIWLWALETDASDRANEGRPRARVELPSVASVTRLGPAGRTLASLDGRGSLRLWRLAGGKPIGEAELLAEDPDFHDLHFGPSGNYLLARGLTGPPRIWRLLGDLAGPLQAQALSNPSLLKACTAIAFDPAGHLLALAARKGEVEIWDLRQGELLWRRELRVAPADRLLLPAGERWLVAHQRGSNELSLWDFHREDDLGANLPLAAHSMPPRLVIASGYGRQLLSVDREGGAWLWPLDSERPASGRRSLPQLPADLRTLRFSPDSDYLLAMDDGWLHRIQLRPIIRPGQSLPLQAPAAGVLHSLDAQGEQLRWIGRVQGHLLLRRDLSLQQQRATERPKPAEKSGADWLKRLALRLGPDGQLRSIFMPEVAR